MNKFQTTTFVGFLLFLSPIFAQPIVIYDNGRAVDAQPFYPFKKPSKSDLKNVPRYQKQTLKQFPVVTPSLSPGKVQANKQVRVRLPRAICIIGEDLQSKHWLEYHYKTLKAVDALCIVVNVSSRARFEEIKNLAPGVEFQALPGAEFARQFNVDHYPLLINQGVIKQ